MKTILFVEDNEALLQLYMGLFVKGIDGWHATGAPNGETALKILREQAFDVVASDIEMPGVNGIQLLAEVCRMHPQTSRVILASTADQAMIANSLQCTHQFIPKPLDARVLRSTLARITGLDGYLADEKLRQLAGRMRTLPSFPTIYLDIIQEIESENSSIESIAKIAAKDPGITAKILQVVNSAAIGFSETVSDPVEAVQLLGMSTTRSLVLSAQVFYVYAPGKLKSFSAEMLWNHLTACGNLARTISREERASVAECEDAYTAGMLHDMGKLMLADSLPDEFESAVALAAQKKIALAEAEMEVFGANHTGLAAYLFGLWGLPAAIVEAVALHLTPQKSNLHQFSALTAVHVANAFTDEAEAGTLDLEYLASIGKAKRVDDWRYLAMNLHSEAAA